MFDALADRLQGAFKSIRGEDKLTADNIEEAIREVRKSLLEADVSLKVVKLFISRVRQKALGTEVMNAVSPSQQFIKVVYDELVTILGGENSPINLEGKPPIVMLLGLQGSGKTTACAKLALKLKNEGMKPLMVACDVQRPAAIMQLQTLGKQIDVPVFSIPGSLDVQEIADQSIDEATAKGLSPVILDTAGRLQIDTGLMAELLILDRALKPAEKLLVVDSMTGQEAVNVSDTFNTQLDVTGILLTKIDGDARGGAALSVREAVGKPVKFISTGEKLQDLEAFYPDRMASRILEMGDVLTLVEKAQSAIDEKEAERQVQQMLQGEFTLEMFINQVKMMKKLGSMGDIMKMMGMGGAFGLNSQQQSQIAVHGEARLALYEIAVNSMTVEERRQPEKIDFARRRRIAKGSGLKESQIGEMLNEFQQMKQMFQMVRQLVPGMGGGGGFPGFPGGGGGGFPFGGGMPKMPPGMPPGLPPGISPDMFRKGGQGPKSGGMPPLGGGYYRKKKKKR